MLKLTQCSIHKLPIISTQMNFGLHYPAANSRWLRSSFSKVVAVAQKKQLFKEEQYEILIVPEIANSNSMNIPKDGIELSNRSTPQVSLKFLKTAFVFEPVNACHLVKNDRCRRCKEKLNTLAISVMNQWPGVKLRVTEGWDEEGKHATDSLHYEGRAVDVTTSDRDRSKYGMLARLAVEAGFDWVYYESRSHIHCSVKSESSLAGKSGGCFPGRSIVRTEDGFNKSLDQLEIGERIAALDSAGKIVYSEVIAFLDRSPEERRQFVRITTASGRALTLTPSHLVPVSLESGSTTEFAAKVRVGDQILVRESDRGVETLRWDRVASTRLVIEKGIFAPLTTEGTVLVDDVVASCYAVVDSQFVAHSAFLPMRIWTNIKSGVARIARIFVAPLSAWSEFRPGIGEDHEVKYPENTPSINAMRFQPRGIHWYASMLYTVSFYVLPTDMLY
ncbi:sonic hedgehog protein A isoform X2 [Neodiprion virginianus]|uniref:sonic hedgehog protein A isoform X2 n=1 Tax=Neodiprion virginianus TaxID=2961670 RepID=UPI001EE6F18E|nr:sonic hedgehog protein A isoform X2 [Neodiprion virginianus]